MKEGRKLVYLEKTHEDGFQKMPPTKPRTFKPQPTLEPALKHWWRARKADVASSLGGCFGKCHILEREDSSLMRDSNPHNSIGGRLGKQTC